MYKTCFLPPPPPPPPPTKKGKEKEKPSRVKADQLSDGSSVIITKTAMSQSSLTRYIYRNPTQLSE